MHYIYTFLLVLFSSVGWAADTILPKNCQVISVTGEKLQLKINKRGLFLIHNISSNALWLIPPAKNDPGVNAGWASKIDENNWSALALDHDLSLNCVESQPGHEQQVPCEGLVFVCQSIKAEFPKDFTGSYWVGENLSLTALKIDIVKRGFQLNKMVH